MHSSIRSLILLWLYTVSILSLAAEVMCISCRWGSCHHVCRSMLPLHHHPQLCIACYMFVKVGVLIWQVCTKRSSNKISLILLSISNPIAVMYIPGCENRVQMESVCSVDFLSISKGMIGRILLSRC